MRNLSKKWMAGAVAGLLAVGGGVVTYVHAGADRKKVSEAIQSSVYIISIDDDSKPLARGSGTVFDSKGLILTNFHVVANEKGDELCNKEGIVALLITRDPKKSAVPTFLGKVVRYDSKVDLAVIEVISDIKGNRLSSPPTMPTIPVGNSDDLQPNDELTIVGYPGLGFDSVTVTTGKVSGWVDDESGQLIKTDAEINPGNSGGTAINDNGELVGVPTFTHEGLKDQRYGKIGLIRPVNLAEPLLKNTTGTGGNQQTGPQRPTTPENPGPTAPRGSSTCKFLGWALREDASDYISEAPTGISALYAYIEYAKIPKRTPFTSKWLLNGQLIEGTESSEAAWPFEGADGAAYLYISTQGTLPDGKYTIQIKPGDMAPITADIVVGGGQAAPPPQRQQPPQNPPQQEPKNDNPFKRPTNPPAQQTAKLTGRVLSADTNRPLQGAYLLVLVPGQTFKTADLNNPEHIYDVVQTDRSGTFESNKGLELDKTYSVAILADGYEPVGGDGFKPGDNNPSGGFINLGDIGLKAK